MGARGFRVALVFILLAVSIASVGSAAAAGQGGQLAPDLHDVAFDVADGVADAGRWVTLDADALSAQRVSLAEQRAPQVVVGPDSRTQVTDTTIFPYSAIAFLELYEADANGDPVLVAACTGAFVSVNVLLTAAHCLWDGAEFGGYVDGIAVVPGANGDVEPFGWEPAAAVWIPEAYTTNSDPGSPYDYGLIVLATTSLGQATGSFEIGILTTAELADPGFNPTTSGYPGDKPIATQWVSSEPAFSQVTDDGLIHYIDSFQGQSGSPVWRGSDFAVVGVESAESDVDNLAVRLDLPIIYQLLGACYDIGCRINHFLTDIPGDGGAYSRVWSRTDQPVASGATARTWMWGPAPISKVMLEPYAEAPNGFRTVLYQEKSRMEITAPDSDPNSIWYVTNGLLVNELMTGRLQLGNDTFEQYEPAQINVAGDQNDPNGPTYATFAGLRSLPPHGGVPQGAGPGPVITATVDRAGNVGNDPSLASYGVTADHYVPETGHRVASVFWEFMNSSGTIWQDGQLSDDLLFPNPFFATGFPVTEAYWTTVLVGGTPRVVLVQVFERRVLTYTPGNPEGFQVEAGNVGSHYYHWRYTLIPLDLPDPPPGNGSGEPIDPPPAIGELLFGTDLSNTPPLTTDQGDVGTPLESSYRISSPPNGFFPLFTDGTYGDAFFTLQARLIEAGNMGVACLMYRLNFNAQTGALANGYWLCLTFENGLLAYIDALNVTPQTLVPLASWEAVEPIPASEWRQFGVIAQGGHFWVVIDGDVIGSFDHDLGPSTGEAGLFVANLADSGPNVVFELTNYGILALAAETSSTTAGGGLSATGDGFVARQLSGAAGARHSDLARMAELAVAVSANR